MEISAKTRVLTVIGDPVAHSLSGAMQQAARLLFPPGAAKEFLTAGVTASIGPLPIDLVLIRFALGPVAIDVSILSLVGVLVAYLIARSLF